MAMSDYVLGTAFPQYRDGDVNDVTLILTEECNLRCHYCYLAHKNSDHVMPREVAYRAIDFILAKPDPMPGLVLNLTGGEPTLEIDLMRDIAAYLRTRLSRMPMHPWHDQYIIAVGSNGTNYCTPEYQDFLWENRGHAYTAITIDGTKAKHDMHRVFSDGRGSYDVVAKSVALWLRQYPGIITKVTFGSEDLVYLCDSILHLWDMGMHLVPANVVFENVWKPGDPELFEEQLRRLADVVVERDLWITKNTTLFWMPDAPHEGNVDGKGSDINWCGTGRMMSIDCRGRIYPCLRFQDYAMSAPGRLGRPLGNIYDGFDRDALRVFYCLRKSLLSPKMCLECDVEKNCAWCSGWNYDDSASETVFVRATYICEMHKARWRANQYLWQQLKAKRGVEPQPLSRSGVHRMSCPI